MLSHKPIRYIFLKGTFRFYLTASLFIRISLLSTWENGQHFETLTLFSPQNDVWATTSKIPYRWRLKTQWIRLVLLIHLVTREICFNQSEAQPRSWLWTSSVWNFLRRHFAGKPVVASRNVGFFLRIPFYTFAAWANAQTHINSSLISSPPVEHLDVGHPVTRAARIDAPTANSACGLPVAI